MRLRPRIAGALLAVAALFSPTADAHADPPHVLLIAPPDDPFASRARAEIEAMGFPVEPAPTLPEDAAPPVAAAARVIESPPPRRIELWIADRDTGRFALRAVIPAAPEDDDASQAFRASERLRAFFRPLPDPPPSPPPARVTPSKAPPAAHSVAEDPPIEPDPTPPPGTPGTSGPRFVLGAAVSVPLQVGGPGIDVTLRFRWMPTRVIGVGALVSIPLLGSTVSAPQGSAGVSAALFGAELSAVFLDARPVRLAASAGLALAWLHTSGAANPPYASHSTSLFTSVPFLGLEVAPRLTDRVRLSFAGHAGVSAPRADVVFASHPVASWGRPLGLVSAGVSVDF